MLSDRSPEVKRSGEAKHALPAGEVIRRFVAEGEQAHLTFRILKRLILVTLALCIPTYLLTRALAAVALDPAVYHRVFDETQLAARVRPDLARLALTQTLPLTQDETPSRDLPELSRAEWEAIAAELLPPDWTNTQAHMLIDGLFAWLNTTDPLPAVHLDLGPVLDRLGSSSGAAALLPFLKDAPACAPGETASGYGVYASCLPPGANVQSLARQTAVRLTQVLPRSLALESLLALDLADPSVVSRLDRMRFTAQWTRVTVRAWGNICLSLLALYGLLTVRGWRGLLTQPIRPLFIAGLLSLLLALVFVGTIRSGALVETIWPGANELGREIVGYLGDTAGARLAAWGVGLLVLSAILWGADYFIHSRRRKPASQPHKPQRTRRQFM